MHHHRRKSGHGSANTSMTDVRKAATASDLSTKHRPSRPAPLTRRHTPQVSQKLGKNPRDRERELEEERWFDEERDSFPTYCMTCEKQFVPQDERFLYCSEACRMHDQTMAPSTTPSSRHSNHHYTAYSHNAGHPEPKDIIPRASPSRPHSTHFCSPPTTPSAAHTSAISALRSLSIRPPSPPSPTQTYSPNIWPFGRSAAASPSTSYTRPVSGLFSSTYDGAYYASAGGGTYSVTSPSADRPLPSRRPGTYSRPKSIELVTPTLGGR